MATRRAERGLWATPLGGGTYRLANLPWIAPDVALGDVVRAEADRDGVLWAAERTERSGNCTIRVAPLDVDQQTVFDTVGAMGISASASVASASTSLR